MADSEENGTSEAREQVRDEIREQIRDEIREQIRDEIREQIRDEAEQEDKQEAKEKLSLYRWRWIGGILFLIEWLVFDFENLKHGLRIVFSVFG